MAEFFGHMREAISRVVVIEDMEAAAFKVIMNFIYTDTVPDLMGRARRRRGWLGINLWLLIGEGGKRRKRSKGGEAADQEEARQEESYSHRE
uniref:Uncharacterized protein n=1 Tax=Aegilops tauschii TaxID=37682 RepID=N1QRK3_AEGTA